MSAFLLMQRKKAIPGKKKVIRKVGQMKENPKITGGWQVMIGDRMVQVSFSRDNMFVYVDGNPIECTAYITDRGYDLDLVFTLEDGMKGHIYSDVEGTSMTNYFFINNALVSTTEVE